MATLDKLKTSHKNEHQSREAVIIRTSIVGILANVFLAAFKAIIGLISNSIAVVLDAVNNLSDAVSSVITIVGTKLAGREPDRKHPFGHGRIEYITAIIISVIILYAGITSLIESVKKIIHPEEPDYSYIALIIIAVAVVVKIILGRYMKTVGRRVNSDSLVNSGEDATLDSVISASTLVAALIFMFSGLSLEAYLGAVISLVIIKSGIDMLRETLSRLLGEKADAELSGKIKKTVMEFPNVMGAYDLIVHNYGPDTFQASIHIEVPDDLSVSQVDDLCRNITNEVYKQHNIILTAVGIYSSNRNDEKVNQIEKELKERFLSHEYVNQVHGFYLDKETGIIRLDAVISFDAPDRSELMATLYKEAKELYPEYDYYIIQDLEFSEE